MHQETEEIRPPWLWALAVFVVIMVIYAITLSPTTAFWDTSEYIAAAKVLGIPHPPGNPLFTLMAHVWGLIPLAGNYAKRINYFAAATSAGGAAFWFLVAERWLYNIVPARLPRIGAAFAGIFASAMEWTVWNQSTVNEKVYTVSMLSIALVTWCMVRWADMRDGPRRNGILILAVYIGALTSTNHMMGVLALPVIGLYIVWTQPRLLREPWVLLMGFALAAGVSGIMGDALTALIHGGNLGNPDAFLTAHAAADDASGLTALMRVGSLVGIVGLLAWGIARNPRNPLLYVGLGAVLIGLSLNYAYLPIRAAQHPAINEGEPIGFFSQALSDVLNRLQYGKPPLSQRLSPLGAQFGMYWHYWSWQWAKDWDLAGTMATALFTGISVAGLWALIRRDRRAGVSAALLLFILTALLIYYLNFKFRFGTPGVDPNTEAEVRERDYFYVASFAFVGVLLAAGFAAAIRLIAEWKNDGVLDARRWRLGTPVLALALIPLFGNRLSAPRNHETLAADFATDMLQSVQPYGILITAGDNDTFPLWFAQEVLGVRQDVTLANLSLMNTEWHLNQLKRRVTPAFDPATAAKLWQQPTDTGAVPLTGSAPTAWVRPTGSVFDESQATLDSIPDLMQAPTDSVQLGTVWVKFSSPTIAKSDIATLLLLKDNLGKRPIYFSWSDGNYPDNLGLADYLVTEGMVRQLMPHPVTPAGPIINSPMGFINIDRTRTLLFDVYHPEAAAHDRPLGWFDPPSSSILALYEIVYNGFAQVLLQTGDSTHAAQAASIVSRIQKSIGNQP